MTAKRQMSLAILIDQATGNHPASWLQPEVNAKASTDIAHYRALARLAERGLFDLFFIADTPATRTENFQAWSRFPMYMNALEPVTLLTALAGATIPHRPRWHGLDELHRTLQRRAPIRFARPHLRRPRGLECRDVGQ